MLIVVIFLLFLTGCATGAVLPVAGPSIVYPAMNDDSYEPGTGWTLAWSDEFQQTSLDENVWTRQKMLYPHNNEMQKYTGAPETAYLEGGNLVLKAEKTQAEVRRGGFTSARVISNPGGQDGSGTAAGKTLLYGKIAARIQLPYGKGLWPAFWLLGDNISETGGDTNWPVCGEIDILESGNNSAPGFGDGTISGALHHDPSVNNKLKQNQYFVAGPTTLSGNELLAEKFHVYEIEWDADKIVWKLDGKEFGEISVSEATRDEFHKPFYVIFNIAVGGTFTTTPDEETPFPQYMYVDWIRHYTR